jgi:hypothetical protein
MLDTRVKRKDRRIVILVDDETYEDLELLVAENYSTISATVRALIDNYINSSQHKTQTYL